MDTEHRNQAPEMAHSYIAHLLLGLCISSQADLGISLWFCLCLFLCLCTVSLLCVSRSGPLVSPLWITFLFLCLCDSPSLDLYCPHPSSNFPSPISLPMPTPYLFLVLWPLDPRLHYPQLVLHPLQPEPHLPPNLFLALPLRRPPSIDHPVPSSPCLHNAYSFPHVFWYL